MKIMKNIIRGRGWLPMLAGLISGVVFAAVNVEAAKKQTAVPVGPEGSTEIELLKIVNMIEPAYPLSLSLQGITSGNVDLVFGVDAEGRLDDFLITSYSRPEFAREVEAVLKRWRFEPMRVDGVPVWSRTQLAFSFEARGVVISRTVMDSMSMLVGDMLEASRRVQVLSRQSELDHPLVVVNAVSPLYPAQLAQSGRTGVVTVEFFVDQEGRVRLPVMEAGAHPWFGEAAAQAVSQWKFEPPMKKGRPTLVRVRQQFVFSAGG